MSKKYLIITTDDAALLWGALVSVPNALESATFGPLITRLRDDTGGDIQAIADDLKAMEVCAACNIEGQSQSCEVHGANRCGRRLDRLIKRANGIIPLGPQERK
jgi:hypothetical protein